MDIVGYLEKDPDYVLGMELRQITLIAQDRDTPRNDQLASDQFKRLLAHELVTSSKLCEYVEAYLSGQAHFASYVVRDIANELGSRLGFEVDHGPKYLQVNKPSFDGLWRLRNAISLAIGIRAGQFIPFDRRILAEIETMLQTARTASETATVLFIVGRADARFLELIVKEPENAKYARIVSLGSLAKMMMLCEGNRSSSYSRRLRALLEPANHARVDSIVDLVAEAPGKEQLAHSLPCSEKNEDSAEAPALDGSARDGGRSSAAAESTIIRDAVVCAFNRKYATRMVRQRGSQTFYAEANHGHGIHVMISSGRFGGNIEHDYSYGYSTMQDMSLQQCERRYIALVCRGDKNIDVFLLPRIVVARRLHLMVKSQSGTKPKWTLYLISENGQMFLILGTHPPLSIQEYRFEVGEGLHL